MQKFATNLLYLFILAYLCACTVVGFVFIVSSIFE